MKELSYVLVSACRNEDAYIGGLIETVARQSLAPRCWVIVDDGSTDGTFERASRLTLGLEYVRLVKIFPGHDRSFTSQVFAAHYGYEQVRGLDFDLVGFLDADLRLETDYYEQLTRRFAQDSNLGLAGGLVLDKYGDKIDRVRAGSEDSHVAGGVQCFRRQCFDQIGGYVPIDGGGQDTIADYMAMMHGWRIQAFQELPVIHLRPEGFGRDGPFRKGLKWGRKFHLIGYHPLFYIGQCLRRIGRRPMILGSLCQLLGYAIAAWKRESRPVSADFVNFLRSAQMRRLKLMLKLPRKLKPGC